MPLISVTKTYRQKPGWATFPKPLPEPTPPGGEQPPHIELPIYIPVVPSFPIIIPPEQPPRPDQGLPPFPSNPIYLPIGGGGEPTPTPPIYLPVRPEFPIVYPPEIDNSLPGGEKPVVTPPIYIPPEAIKPLPPSPEHPIYWPAYPDNTLPVPPGGGTEPPLVIWGPNDPRPSLPIYIPIEPPTPPEGGGNVPSHPIYLPVYPDQGLPGDQPGIDIGFPGDQPGIDNTLPPQQPDAGLKPDNPIVLPPIDLPEGQTTIYVSLTPGVPVEVNVPAGSRRKKR